MPLALQNSFKALLASKKSKAAGENSGETARMENILPQFEDLASYETSVHTSNEKT